MVIVRQRTRTIERRNKKIEREKKEQKSHKPVLYVGDGKTTGERLQIQKLNETN